MSYVIFIFGAAGVGKTTFCKNFKELYSRKRVNLINLDPGSLSEDIQYDISITDYISIDDIMMELDLGPNGGMFECLSYLNEIFFPSEKDTENNASIFKEDSIILFDCPGKIELFLHSDILPQFINKFKNADECSVAIAFITDISSLYNYNKMFFNMLIISLAVNRFSLPVINLINKLDLMEKFDESPVKYDIDSGMITIEDVFTTKPSMFDTTLKEFIEMYGLSQFIPINWEDDEHTEFLFLNIERVLNMYD